MTEVDAALRQVRPGHDLDGLRALAGIRSRLFGRTTAPLRVGRYVLRERLGAGGLGVVHAALDPELEREVAIKLVRQAAGPEHAREQGRLLREARAMARLSHPNVVEVFDVGTYEGLEGLGGLPDEAGALPSRGVFIVMARLEGQTLQQWLEDEPRPWQAVLACFVAAGRGLAAAHHTGLVHRDFKPANVFVERDGRVRVLDFGLARGYGPGSSSTTTSVEVDDPLRSLTLAGTVLGTPAYMAPEQHDGGTVDARSDQYGFCAALYHGLYGALPFRSAALDRLAEDKRALVLAPAPGGARVPRWLRATVLRGLSPDPRQRWPSMDALLHALDHRPRAARRHRALALGAGALGVGLAAWATLDPPRPRCTDHDLAAMTWNESSREEVARALAAHDAGRPAVPHVLARLDAQATAWRGEHQALCEAMLTTPDDPALDLRMGCLRQAAAHLDALVGVLREADADVAAQAHTAVAQLPAVERCHDVERLRAELGPSVGGADEPAAEALRAGLAEVSALLTAGKIDEALVRARARADDARALDHPPLLAESLWWEGHIRRIAGELEPALPVLEHAAHTAAAHGHDKIAALAAVELTLSMSAMARYDEALEWARHAEAAALRYGEGRYPLARAHAAKGTVLRQLGQHEQAYERYLEALAVQQRADPEGHELATILNNLGTAALGLGRHEEALAHYTRSHERLEALLGGDHPQTAAARMNLGIVTAELGRHELARAHYAAAREAFVRLFGPHDQRVAYCDTNLGNLLLELGRAQQAHDRFAAARDVFTEILGPTHPNTATARAGLGLALLRLDRPRQAHDALEQARVHMSEALGAEHPTVGVVTGQVGQALLAAGDLAAARDRLEAAVAQLERVEAEPSLVHEARFHLARAQWEAGDRQVAWSRAREVQAWLERRGPSSALAEVQAWLAAHPRP